MTVCSKGCGRPASRRGMCGNHYEQYRTRQQAYGRWESTYTDAAPTRAHIEALIAAGVGKRRIAELSGVNRNNLQWITRGRPERGSGPSSKIKSDIAQRILAVPVPDITSQRDVLAAGDIVASTGTVRRLQALVSIGYTQGFLSGRIGIEPRNAKRLFHEPDRYVTVRYARTVAALFDELQLTPGPSNRARRHAARHGWVPPLAWDEDSIDDPEAAPDRGPTIRRDFAETYAELRDDLMLSDADIARRLGIKFAGLERQLYRYNLPVSVELKTLVVAERSQRESANAQRVAS